MPFRLLPVLLFFGLLTACNSNTASENTTAPSSPVPSTTASTSPGKVVYPSISTEQMQTLWNNTTTIDYLFYELPLSMSMTETPAIQNVLRQVANQPALIKENCKAMGRVFFQENGNPLAEADFFFTPDCTYFVFYENQKPVKSNQMTPEGVAFFQQLLNNASQAKGQ